MKHTCLCMLMLYGMLTHQPGPARGTRQPRGSRRQRLAHRTAPCSVDKSTTHEPGRAMGRTRSTSARGDEPHRTRGHDIDHR